MIPPPFLHRFEGDPGIDVGTQEIDAIFPDGEKIRVVLRIGAPYKIADDDHRIRAELENLDRTDCPLAGVTSMDTLINGLNFMVTRLAIYQERHGCRYYWPDSNHEFDFQKILGVSYRKKHQSE